MDRITALDTIVDIVVDLGALVPSILTNGSWVQETQDCEQFLAQSSFVNAARAIELSDVNDIVGKIGIMDSFCLHPRALLPSGQSAVQFLEADGAELVFSNLRLVTYEEIETSVSGTRFAAAMKPIQVRRHWSNRASR